MTERTVGDLVEAADLGSLASLPVFFGGPVGRDRITFAHFRWRTEAQSIECNTGLELEEARSLMLQKSGIVRAFVGYSGWSGGQLEREMEEGAWKICSFTRHMMDERLIQGLWPFFIADDTRWHKLLAYLPRLPELN